MAQRDTEDELAVRTPDAVAAVARAVAGMAPIIGPLLAELVGTIIPGQRTGRVAEFCVELDARVSKLEQVTLESQLEDPEFCSLLEEGFCSQPGSFRARGGLRSPSSLLTASRRARSSTPNQSICCRRSTNSMTLRSSDSARISTGRSARTSTGTGIAKSWRRRSSVWPRPSPRGIGQPCSRVTTTTSSAWACCESATPWTHGPRCHSSIRETGRRRSVATSSARIRPASPESDWRRVSRSTPGGTLEAR